MKGHVPFENDRLYLLAIRSVRSGIFGRLIRFVQFFHSSARYGKFIHVGLMYNGFIVEALPGHDVVHHSLAEMLDLATEEDPDIHVFLVPLKPKDKNGLEITGLEEWVRIKTRVGQPYDYWGAVLAGTDFLERFGWGIAENKTGLWFCSKVIAWAFRHPDYAEVTPSDVCDWSIWDWTSAIVIYENHS